MDWCAFTGKVQTITDGGVQALVHHLSSASVTVRTHVTGALALLSISLDAMTVFDGCGSSAAAALVALLSDASEDITTNSRISVRHFAQLPPLLARFVGLLVHDLKLLMVVFGDYTLPFVQPLCDLLSGGDAPAGTSDMTIPA